MPYRKVKVDKMLPLSVGARIKKLWLDKADNAVYPDNAFNSLALEKDLPDNILSLASDKKKRCNE